MSSSAPWPLLIPLLGACQGATKSDSGQAQTEEPSPTSEPDKDTGDTAPETGIFRVTNGLDEWVSGAWFERESGEGAYELVGIEPGVSQDWELESGQYSISYFPADGRPECWTTGWVRLHSGDVLEYTITEFSAVYEDRDWGYCVPA